LYEKGGLSLLLNDKRIGFKPSKISKTEHLEIAAKLKDPAKGLSGYVELQEWIKQKFDNDIKYNTLLKYCHRNYGSKSKVARKSPIKKDFQAIEDFKRTSEQAVEKFTKKTEKNIKK
jgi:hypothetical protein